MGIVLGCIADDFTGASDLAAILARSGHKVGLRIGLPDGDDVAPVAPFEVIALKCRTEPVDQAVSQTTRAADWLMKRGAKRLYWKYCSTFDSTPEGNIGPVAEALMRQTGAFQTIYCPAFPENGRSIYMGNLFVGNQPLNESPMKDHPLTPMRDANLIRLLTPQVEGKVGHIAWPDVAQGNAQITNLLKRLASNGFAHVIPDAISQSDLQQIAQAVQDFRLITGGSALALDLPRLYEARGLIGEPDDTGDLPIIGKGQIVLSGSCPAMTRAQVAHFTSIAASHQLDPLALAHDGTALHEARNWLATLAPDAPKIIYATADPQDVARSQEVLGREKAGNVVETALAQLAQDAYELGVRRFVVAGGETSGAVTQALATDRLIVGREIAPGVPWCFANRNGETFAITLKSGNFGNEQFFTSAFGVLDQSTMS